MCSWERVRLLRITISCSAFNTTHNHTTFERALFALAITTAIHTTKCTQNFNWTPSGRYGLPNYLTVALGTAVLVPPPCRLKRGLMRTL